MRLETSFDDGGVYDYKICELLKKYNLSGTFYIPTINDLSEPEIITMSNDFEIGGHTTTHPRDMKLLSEIDQYNEIKDNKDYLEQLIGRKINSFCYPRGRYNEITIEQVKKVGYKEARTTIQNSIDKPIDIFRMKTSIHIYPENKEYNKPNFLKEGKRLFKEAFNNNGYYHIWGHSEEIEKFKMWDELEELFKYIFTYTKKQESPEEYFKRYKEDKVIKNLKVVLS